MSGVKRRPCGPVRQLSLQTTSTATSTYLPGGASLAARRNQLRKQSSEDIWHSGGSGTPPMLCVGGSRSTPTVSRTRPPPVRLAWGEQRRSFVPPGEAPADPPKVEVEVVARKCALPQPRTRPPPKLASQQQEALDGSRLRLAERLRLAWQQSATTTNTNTAVANARARTNLDIFLAHNSNNINAPPAPSTHQDNQVIRAMDDQDPSTIVSAQNYIGVSEEQEQDEQEEEEKEDKKGVDEELRSRSFGCLKSGTEEVEEGKKNDFEGKMMLVNNREKEGKSICISITDRTVDVEGGEDNRRNKFSDDSELEDDDDDDNDEGRIVQQRLKSARSRNGARGGASMTSSPDLVGCSSSTKKGETPLGTPSASRSSTPGGQQTRPELPRRLMSAPPQTIQRRPASQQEKSSSPLIQQARRKLKSARRKQQKPTGDEEDISSGEDIEQKPRRSRSARTSEVITMVSLLSPGQSEQEEEDCVTMVLGATTVIAGDQHSAWQDGCQSRMGTSGANSGGLATSNPVAGSPFLNGSATNPILCIRKPVKTVSFQQQSGARSYANNFPSRRGAAILPEESHNPAPPVLRSTSLVAAAGGTSGSGSGGKGADANPVAALKRKLVRAKSSNESGALPMMSNEEENEEEKQSSTTDSTTQPIQIVLSAAKNTCEDNKNSRTYVDGKHQNKVENEEENNEEEDEADDVPEFKTPKEQECWDLFRRMADKGITVSFETVLRGMLTPTEYRLRRHNLLTS